MNEQSCPTVVVSNRRPDRSGKVRDIFDLGDSLIIVATDRLSAFDVILPDTIPGKGKVLHHLTRFWLDRLSDIAPNPVISYDVADFPPPFNDAKELLADRSVLTRRADVFPFECVVRGYLSGSGWKSYKETGEICSIPIPSGMKESERLKSPLFTPTTKAAEGHDMPVTFDRMVIDLGGETAERLRGLALDLYRVAAEHAGRRGILIADTKFEFGRLDGAIHLVDEVLTPDSSRFWKEDRYEPGKSQDSFDKQFVREYLLGLGWRGDSPPPHLPSDIVRDTAARYREILDILTKEGSD